MSVSHFRADDGSGVRVHQKSRNQTTSKTGKTHGHELSYVYTLTWSTFLRRLHIKVDHAKKVSLLPETVNCINSHCSPRYLPDRVFEKQWVRIRDQHNRVLMVLYECVLVNGQRHSRICKGWSNLCRANYLKVGDQIVLRGATRNDDDFVEIRETRAC